MAARAKGAPGKRIERRMDADRRRSQLLDCAIRVASRRGLGSSPHAATAREANVSVPTVFAYFRSRSDLVRAIVEDVERLYIELGSRYLRRDKPAPQAMFDFLRACAHTAETDPDRVRVWLDWSSTVGSELWPLYLDFHERSIRRMAAVVRRGQREGSIPKEVDATDAARLLFASGHTVAHMIFSGTSEKTVERFQNHVISSALHLEPFQPGIA
jgi:TetR/AcrR family hemagglutinin/protease transcriptional regulator